MLWLKRPPVDAAFETRKAKLVGDLRLAFANNQMPKIDKALWSDFKVAFARQQLNRCGYCELNVISGQPGDVEHYAPKNEVTQFGANGVAEEGTEAEFNATIRGRRPSERWTPAYWWLAYEWTNYLLSCRTCNSDWKGTLFPVRQPPSRLRPHKEADPEETCLLLNPYGSRDPARHLCFHDDGNVEPRNSSPFGRETIRTCGLNRLALVPARANTCARAYDAAAVALSEMKKGKAVADNQGLKDLYRMGTADARAEFPGVVRAIILDQLFGTTWSQLEKIFPAA